MMPFYANHPRTLKQYHIDDWIKLFPKLLPICTVCTAELKIRAIASPNSRTHFYHEDDSNCPTIDENRRKYEGLRPTEKDYDNARLIRQITSDNLYKVYLKCKYLLSENLSHSTFKEMLVLANDREIWYYKGLDFKYVPYVLLVNYGIFREQDVFFVFDSNLTSYDVLWNQTTNIKKKIWRINNKTRETKAFGIVGDLIEKEHFKSYKDLLK